MANPKLEVTLRRIISEIDKLDSYRVDAQSLEARYQHFISELIMLRLFSAFEEGVSDIAFKLASGAVYTNGTSPALTVLSPSMSSARSNFLSHGRRKPVLNLKWTKSRFIRESVEHVIPASDPFVRQAQNHGTIINEMRIVRNVLAHKTTSAKRDFRTLVRQAYGGNAKVTPGVFLTSSKRFSRPRLVTYLTGTKIVLREMASGR
ncbi:hypothetical protein [Marinobacter mangrovi]|uniref:hypothetical protein n=1 Tax=Marinobacter mangrovi TaxID=2803918 RepID=UPI001931C794|nr:hypothetical protein [Marinobacter mangrovi]